MPRAASDGEAVSFVKWVRGNDPSLPAVVAIELRGHGRAPSSWLVMMKRYDGDIRCSPIDQLREALQRSTDDEVSSLLVRIIFDAEANKP